MFVFRFIYSFFIDKLIYGKFYLFTYILIMFFFKLIKLKIFSYKAYNIKSFIAPTYFNCLIYQILPTIKLPKLFFKLPNVPLHNLKFNFKDIFWREFIHIDIYNGLLEFAFFYYVPIKKNYVLGFSKFFFSFHQFFYFQNCYITYTIDTNIFLTFIFTTFNYLFKRLKLYNFFYIIFNFNLFNFNLFNLNKLNCFLYKIIEISLYFFILFIWLFFYFYFYKYMFSTVFYFTITLVNKLKKLLFIVNYFNFIIYSYMYINIFVKLTRLYVLNFFLSSIKKFSSLFKLFNLKIKKIFKLKSLILKLKIYNLYKNYK